MHLRGYVVWYAERDWIKQKGGGEMEEFKQQADSFHVWTRQGRETITVGMFKSDSVPVPFLTSFIPHIFGIVLGKQAQVPLQEPLVPLFQQVAVQVCVHAFDGYKNL